MPPTSPSSLLADLRRAHAGGPPPLADVQERHGLRPLTGGFQNAVYAWDDPATGPSCLKLFPKGNHRRRVDREWAALTLLAEHGVADVPRPLWRDDRDGVPAIGMTLLAGTPLLAGADPQAALEGLARTCRRLREVPLSGLLAGLERVDSAAHYARRLTGSWPELLSRHEDDPLTADCVPCSPPGATATPTSWAARPARACSPAATPTCSTGSATAR